jgi:GTPase SAR1 family protein
LQESIDLFDEHTNSRFFQDVPIVLFLNKEDLFREKIAKKSISETFPDYKGEQDFESSFQYIKKTFLDTNKFDPDRMHVFIAQATDSKCVQNNFNDILQLIKDKKVKQKD